jgi:hypothetical protein
MDDMSNELLSDRWYLIARALALVMEQLRRLPEREKDPEFGEWLNKAFDHAERRADALIDPS